MDQPQSPPPRHSPQTLRELAPVWIALGGTVVAAALAASGTLGWLPAQVFTLLVWGAAAAGLVRRLLSRDRRLDRQREQVETMQELQAQYGIAEGLGGFGIWVIDRIRNRQVWSAGAFRLFGVDAGSGEPTVKEFAKRIHQDDRDRWLEAHRRALRRGGEARVEYRFVRDSSDVVWLRSIGRAERNAHGAITGLGGVVQDITGIRAMQQQLAASEAKFRDLTHMSSDWIWETDTSHQWSYFSGSVDAVLGRWVRGMIGQRLWDLPDSQFAFEQPDWQAQRELMDAHAPFENFEYAVIAPEGAAHFVSISGRATFDDTGAFSGYRGVGRNITREKQQRLLLRIESEIASIMREQNEPERVVTAIIVMLCGVLGWIGGANLTMLRGRNSYIVRERWGYPSFTRMISQLAQETPLQRDSAEGRVWTDGKAEWITDLADEPLLERRYQTERLGARAAFLAPIVDELGKTLSVMLFLSPASFRDDGFLRQVAEILARNLALYLQRKAAEKRLTHQSLHDALTNLPNRIFLTHQLGARLERGEAAAVLYIDLDRYKIINDTLGHSVGDQVLIEVASRLKESIRPQDVAGRIGGDEFILLLTGLSERGEIERIARRVLAAIEKPFVLMNRAYFLSASIGVAIAPDDGKDAQMLLKCADNAMYRVKASGRNDVRFFAGDISDERTEQLQLATELPLALRRGEVDMFYQPILDVGERRVTGLEGLLRWRHPIRGMLYPESFLPIAEQSNLIREVGMWALRRALDDRVALGLDRYPDAAVSVNVSARQLDEEDFLATLNAMLAERYFPATLLRLELTESTFIEHPERTGALIAELRRIGVRVIIDNFGTGYASLSYLKNLPVDGLKIDRTFVRDLPADRGNAAIIQAITTLAAKLGVQAMAVGVETAAELNALRSFDCHQMQGRLISEPLPFLQLREFMDALPAVRKMHLVSAGSTKASAG